eukprot:CAMPEP_0201576294 /NCGR_PEP_ID=MMETSP0190_2-20130828/22034_1 /ASSEMBLY_ACC=CAM_ASM_000263 /TAXON_ID=37353 /ORGANISM="Rosalina sp." /LENGTH=128 /DNA_ID=CAMNT_0048006999 /DNA_START=1 /DNA_END=383 /DNA_ORIENTATION=-
MYDAESGAQTFSDLEWPRYGIKDPCIAIDEDNNRIYAVGGWKNEGQAVSRIQGFQFTDDTLTSGAHMDSIDGWVLDTQRYGSTCFYWKYNDKEYIVAINGMTDKSMEYQDKENWMNDIVVLPIPTDKA